MSVVSHSWLQVMQRKSLTRLFAVLAIFVASMAAAAASSAGVAKQSIWAPCRSSEPGPAYVVIVKGVYGTCVHYTAQVFQFDTVTGPKAMLVAITNEGYGVWTDLVWVNLATTSLGRAIYENDIVYLVGRLDGTTTYTTSLGGTNTVPVIDVTQLRRANSGPKPTATTVPPPRTTTTVPPRQTTTTVAIKPARPGVKVIASAHASGAQAEAIAIGDATAFPIEVLITSTPHQAADLSWSLACDEGNGGIGSVQGEKTVPLPVVYRLRAPSGSTDCETSADVTLSGTGSLTVKIED